MQAIQLRPHQLAAIHGGPGPQCEGIWPLWKRGLRRLLVVLCTGGGKTVLFLEVARRIFEKWSKPILIVTHRIDLSRQVAREARGKFGFRVAAVHRGKQFAEFKDSNPQIVVTTDKTMARRLDEFTPEDYGLIIIDEAHHATGGDVARILEKFRGRLVLGVTATPDRADGVGLKDVFEAVAFRYEIHQGIEDGYLVPIVAKRIVLPQLKLDALKSKDFADKPMSELMSQAAVIHASARSLVEQVGRRKTLVFCTDVAHARALAAALGAYTTARAEAIDGSMPYEDGMVKDGDGERFALGRDTIVSQFRAGQVQFLINVGLMTEGTDIPEIECVAIMRPMRAPGGRGLYVQAAGRGLRVLPGVADGLATAADRRTAIAASRKPHVLLLDFTGATEKHSLVGPEDCLGHALTPEERVLVERELDGSKNLQEALAAARKALLDATKSQAALAELDYLTRKVSPFDPIRLLGSQVRANPMDRTPPSDRMVAALERFGIKDPRKYNAAQCGKLIKALIERADAGLCTLKQYELLERHVPVAVLRAMSRETASALITELRDHKFRRPAAWDTDPRLSLAKRVDPLARRAGGRAVARSADPARPPHPHTSP